MTLFLCVLLCSYCRRSVSSGWSRLSWSLWDRQPMMMTSSMTVDDVIVLTPRQHRQTIRLYPDRISASAAWWWMNVRKFVFVFKSTPSILSQPTDQSDDIRSDQPTNQTKGDQTQTDVITQLFLPSPINYCSAPSKYSENTKFKTEFQNYKYFIVLCQQVILG